MDDGRDPLRDKALGIVVVALVAVLVFRNAWVGDDAYVTLRTVDHFVEGRGLVYNVGERAQAYTHPLWLVLITPFYALWGHPWWTVVAVGAATTLATVAFTARRLAPADAAPLLVCLPLSRAFVDFGTSGLENPLSHLLLVGLAAAWFGARDKGRRLSLVALATALLGLTRLDLLALAGPCLLAAIVSARWDLSLREIGRRLVVGLSPLVVWHLFALVYYGSLLPTSAIAKLNTGLSGGALAKQGLLYLLYQAEWDAVTLLVLIAGTAAPFVVRDRAALPLAVGNLLYVAYVVRVGGDFMAGRFLTAPMLVGLVLLMRLPLDRPRAWGLTAVLAAVALSSPSSPLRPVSTVEYGRLNDRGVVDERLYYAARGAGIGTVRHYTDDPEQQWKGWAGRAGPGHVQVDEPVGYPAFYAHPRVHWVSRYAITDPLLARLPPFRTIQWRPGHYDRVIPEGYIETLQSGRNQIEDPEVARLYDAIHLVNTAPLFSSARLGAIWALNTGGLPVDPNAWRYPTAREMPDGPPPYGNDRLDAPGTITVDDSGAVRRFEGGTRAAALDFRRRDVTPFRLVFERDGSPVGHADVGVSLPWNDRLGWTRVEVPRDVARGGYDAVRILPTGGTAPYVVHYLAVAR